MARTRATLITLLTSYAGAGISIVKGVVFVPLYLKLLGLDVYGAWLASANVIGLLGMVDAGIGGVIQQQLADTWGRADIALFARLTGAGLFCTGVVSALVIALAAVCAPFVPGIVSSPHEVWRVLSVTFLLTGVSSAGNLLLGTLLSIAAAWQRTQIGAVARLSGQLLETVLIAAGLFAGLGVLSLGLGALGGVALSLAISVVSLARGWRELSLPPPQLRRADLSALTRLALPSMLSRVFLQIDANIEVAMISAVIGPGVAAIYAMTDRVLKLAMNFINPLANSVLSSLAHFVGVKSTAEAARPVRELFGIWSIAVAAVLPALLAFNQDFTSLWVGAANYGGLPLNAAFFLSETLGGRELLLSVILIAVGGLQTSAWISTGEVIVRLPLMYLGLRLAGPLGIPLATAAVSLLALAVYVRELRGRLALDPAGSARLHSIGALVIATSFALGLAEARWLPHATTWPWLICKGAGLGLVHAALALSSSGREALVARVQQLRASR